MLTPTRLADVIAEQEAIFVKRQPKSAALAGRAAGVLAGGVTSNWQITQPHPVWLSHGAGGKVYDAGGNEYVDLHGGYGAALAGHAHPAITGLTLIAQFNDLASVAWLLDAARRQRRPRAERARLHHAGDVVDHRRHRVRRVPPADQGRTRLRPVRPRGHQR